MRMKDIRSMNKKQLIEKLKELKKELIKQRASIKTQNNTMIVRNIKKDIARILTVLNNEEFSSKSLTSENIKKGEKKSETKRKSEIKEEKKEELEKKSKVNKVNKEETQAKEKSEKTMSEMSEKSDEIKKIKNKSKEN